MLPVDNETLFYRIALTFVKDIGPRRSRTLLEQFGDAPAIFKAPLKELKKIDGLTETRVKAFKDPQVLAQAETELKYVEKNQVQILWFGEDTYPQRLKNCSDAPVLLYHKGNTDLNAQKIVAVIGTRKSTDYGHRVTEGLLNSLKGQENMVISSGLAHGIDALAHKYSLQVGLPTVGVLGHGLDRVYPATNKQLAKEMMENGGLLSEFPSGTLPDRSNFPMRNRIVAGISDVTVVVESDIKGGALITARIADSYNREVAAFPGRVYDTRSSGCNELIRTNVAAMITNADDLLELMNWNTGKKQKPVQKQLFIQLSEDEQKIVDLLQTKDSMHADELLYQTGIANSQLPAVLLQLEMQGLIKALPGKQYRMN
ncbi:DNA-processing protein DprA [Polluticoccus soli]|uniref:DNA-processing protein DprA n=1 Tax=Polluticoccus soli TaxID=3034150 RepID=UPI0023E2BE4E|nr:DNA-processing protein DprA [Flavipsychrobacter sp. JY13-12]